MTATIISIMAMSMTAHAVTPLLEDGKSWNVMTYVSLYVGVDTISITEYKVSGDTIVQGKEAKIIKRNVAYKKPYMDIIDTPLFIIEEDGLYSLYNEHPTDENPEAFLPLLNFDMHKGDAIGRVTISDERIINIRGVDRRVLVMGEYPNCCYWIEGIGSPNFYYITPEGPVPPGHMSIMTDCYQDGRSIFKYEDLELFSGVEPITADHENDGYKLYDLYGREVGAPIPGNVYIRGKHKIIWQ